MKLDREIQAISLRNTKIRSKCKIKSSGVMSACSSKTISHREMIKLNVHEYTIP